MRLKKFPVFVNGEEYKIVLRREFDECCLNYYWKAKFYRPGELRRCFVCFITEGNKLDPVDYVKVAKEAVNRFEFDTRYDDKCKDKLKEFEEWDGK